MTVWLLRLHRWVALIFALPLVIVLVTGLILSFEPWVVARAIQPGSLTTGKIEALIAKHDPKGEARGIVYRPYDNTLTIGSGRGGTVVDVSSSEAMPGLSRMASFLLTSRRLHETLLIDASWLVVASTTAMLVLALLGVLMGLPRFSNTLSGWHKTMAWGLLPLVVLSPLTGLFIAWGITFIPAPPAATGGQAGGQRGAGGLPLVEAVRVVAKSHDLSGLVWIRPQGGGMAARIVEGGGEYRGYRVNREGTVATPRNVPRLWHEGTLGSWAAFLNIVTSFALISLLVTGLTMWAHTQLRRMRRKAARAVEASA